MQFIIQNLRGKERLDRQLVENVNSEKTCGERRTLDANHVILLLNEDNLGSWVYDYTVHVQMWRDRNELRKQEEREREREIERERKREREWNDRKNKEDTK